MADERPAAAIGHVLVHSRDVQRTEAFYRSLGMRPVESGQRMAILELRGGTHLLIMAAQGSDTESENRFDLMVDDIESTRAMLKGDGQSVTDLKTSSVHKSFEVTDPDGRSVHICSNHTGGQPV